MPGVRGLCERIEQEGSIRDQVKREYDLSPAPIASSGASLFFIEGISCE
jgi:hypothetical protein